MPAAALKQLAVISEERIYGFATHEAGHAILAMLLGYLFWVRIQPNTPMVKGQTSCGADTGDKVSLAIIALGGYAAQKELLGVDDWNGARGDFAEAWLAVGPDFMEDYYPIAAQYVLANAAAIRGVADALMAARDENGEAELDVTQVWDIYQRCQGSVPQARDQAHAQVHPQPAALQPEPMPLPVPEQQAELEPPVTTTHSDEWEADYQRTVYHELGHGISAIDDLINGWLISVRVHPNSWGWRGGVTQCGHFDPVKDAIIDIAGYAATRELLGVDDTFGPSQDFEHARSNVGDDFMDLYPQTAQIILDNEPAIRFAAAEMTATRDENSESHMTGERVREIYEYFKQRRAVQPAQQPIPDQQRSEPRSDFMPENNLPIPQINQPVRPIPQGAQPAGQQSYPTPPSLPPPRPPRRGPTGHMPFLQKTSLFFFIVLVSACAIAYCNYNVFPDSQSFRIACAMLLISVGVAGIFTWNSRKATPKIQRYCSLAHGVICITLAINLGMHWLLQREVSAANHATELRHVEEDRAADFRKQESAQRVAEMKAQAQLLKEAGDLTDADRRRMIQLPTRRRESAIRPGQFGNLGAVGGSSGPQSAQTGNAPSVGEGNGMFDLNTRATYADVIKKWWYWLTIMAFIDALVSIIAGAILMIVWEWDLNGDGIDDAKQPWLQQQPYNPPMPPYAPQPAYVPQPQQPNNPYYQPQSPAPPQAAAPQLPQNAYIPFDRLPQSDQAHLQSMGLGPGSNRSADSLTPEQRAQLVDILQRNSSMITVGPGAPQPAVNGVNGSH